MRVAAGVFVSLFFCSSASGQSRYAAARSGAGMSDADAGCGRWSAPANPDVLVLRFWAFRTTSWPIATTSSSLDAGIDKLAWWAPNNITPEEMTKHVNAILIGHAHGETSGTRRSSPRRPARSWLAIRSRCVDSSAPVGSATRRWRWSRDLAAKRSSSTASRSKPSRDTTISSLTNTCERIARPPKPSGR